MCDNCNCSNRKEVSCPNCKCKITVKVEKDNNKQETNNSSRKMNLND